MTANQSPTAEEATGAKILFTVAALVVVVSGLKLGSPVLMPFFLSLFLAILSFPLLFWLKGKGAPTWLSILSAVLVNLGVVTVMALLAVQSVSNFQERAPQYIAKFQALIQNLQTGLAQGTLPGASYLSFDLVNPSAVVGMAQDTLAQLMSLLSNGFLVFLMVVFLLGEAITLPEKLKAIACRTGNNDADPARFKKITREVVQYLGIKTVVSLATGLVIGVGVALLGLDFPVLWGLLAFALNYIPTIGSIVAAIPALILAIVQPGGEALAAAEPDAALLIDWGRVLGVGMVYLSVNVVFGNFIEPMLMGKRLGISTLVVVLSLVFWGWVWGPVGMLLSVPLTMVVKIMLENTPDLRWIALLLGDSAPPVPVADEDETSDKDSLSQA